MIASPPALDRHADTVRLLIDLAQQVKLQLGSTHAAHHRGGGTGARHRALRWGTPRAGTRCIKGTWTYPKFAPT